MEIQKSDLEVAVAHNILTAESRDALWQLLENRQQGRPSLRGAHILYYLGGMLAIGALSLFMTLGWELFGGWGLCAIAVTMGGGTLALTGWLLERKGQAIPAGILLALTVVLVPLAIYGLQVGLGWWAESVPYRDYHTHIDWRWLMMELGTLAVGLLLLWRFRLPFAVMPVAVTLWYMSMDLLPFLMGGAPWDRELGSTISLLFGLAMIFVALWVEWHTRSDQDFAFWLYLFGVISFWGGLSLQRSDHEWGRFLYFCLNAAMVLLGGLLVRRVFVVFGGLGMIGYLFHLSHKVFADSRLFPFVLVGMGLGLIYLGLLWQRHEATVVARCQRLLPLSLRAMWERRG
ncbi:MAG: DUF2157 domain-containing protein [Magnetococcales bacterium]|nr:DUF2157 domain-containing protein [Magnetococcales bacterium]